MDTEQGLDLEINRELVLSTSHIPYWLSTQLDWGPVIGLICNRVEHGWMIYTALDASPLQVDRYPPELRPLIRLARIHGCKWLHLDQDGPVVEGLQTWDW